MTLTKSRRATLTRFACLIFLCLTFQASAEPSFTGYHELIAKEVNHFRYKDGKVAYAARIASVEILREPVMGALSIRGKNQLRLTGVKIETDELSFFQPIIRCFGGSRMRATLTDVTVIGTGHAPFRLQASIVESKSGVIAMRSVVLTKNRQRSQADSAIYDPVQGQLRFASGQIVEVGD